MLKNHKSLEDFNCVSDEELFTELTPAEGASISAGFSTGVWKANDQGTYYVRRDGNKLWWFGENGGFSNVFQGTINGDNISGEWVDVPKNRIQNKGVLVLRKINSNSFEKIFQTGGFFASTWTLESSGFPT